jgi:hypothetical protein
MKLLPALLLLILASPALAQDKQSVSDWFRSLRTPMPVGGLPAGVSCCDAADCKMREVRQVGFIEEAWIEEIGQWAVIPLEARITDPEILEKRPLFGRVVCYVPMRGVVCDVAGQSGG